MKGMDFIFASVTRKETLKELVHMQYLATKNFY